MNLTRTEQLIADMTREQVVFVNELILNGGNQYAAYLKAYPSSSEASAKSNSSHIMKKENVMELYRLEQMRTLDKYKITRSDLIAMHMRIINCYEKLLTLIEKPNKTPQDYQDISTFKGFIKASDYKEALEQIGKLQGDYIERHEINDNRQVIRIITNEAPTTIEAEDVSNIIVDLPNIIVDLPQNSLLEQSDPNNGIKVPSEGDNASNGSIQSKSEPINDNKDGEANKGSNNDNKDDGNEMPF